MEHSFLSISNSVLMRTGILSVTNQIHISFFRPIDFYSLIRRGLHYKIIVPEIIKFSENIEK